MDWILHKKLVLIVLLTSAVEMIIIETFQGGEHQTCSGDNAEGNFKGPLQLKLNYKQKYFQAAKKVFFQLKADSSEFVSKTEAKMQLLERQGLRLSKKNHLIIISIGE